MTFAVLKNGEWQESFDRQKEAEDFAENAMIKDEYDTVEIVKVIKSGEVNKIIEWED